MVISSGNRFDVGKVVIFYNDGALDHRLNFELHGITENAPSYDLDNADGVGVTDWVTAVTTIGGFMSQILADTGSVDTAELYRYDDAGDVWVFLAAVNLGIAGQVAANPGPQRTTMTFRTSVGGRKNFIMLGTLVAGLAFDERHKYADLPPASTLRLLTDYLLSPESVVAPRDEGRLAALNGVLVKVDDTIRRRKLAGL